MAQFFIEDSDLAPLKDKTIIVTGGSSGMGLATTELLLQLGNKVVVGDVNDSPVTHENHTFVKTDVSSWDQLKNLFKTAKDKYGRIDCVFSNAGIPGKAAYLSDNYDEQGELLEPATITYDVNLRGLINTSYLGIHHMRNQSPPGGSIVLTASGTAFQRFQMWDYTTTKHGVYGWMRGAIPNLQEQNLPIRINTLGPSWTLSPLLPKALCEQAGIETQSTGAVARGAAYLFADESRQGQFIFAAGGRYYEIEESTMLPIATKLIGGPEHDENEGMNRIKKLARAAGYQNRLGQQKAGATM